MRKILAIALAVAMVMSMAAVSFAAVSGKSATGWADAAGSITQVGTTIYRYDSDADTLTPIEGLSNARYGSSVYIPLQTAGNAPVTKYDFVEGLKIKAKWEMGGELVDGMKLAKLYTKATSALGASGWYILEKGADAGTGAAQYDMITGVTEDQYSVATGINTASYVKGAALDTIAKKHGARATIIGNGDDGDGNNTAKKSALVVEYYDHTDAEVVAQGTLFTALNGGAPAGDAKWNDMETAKGYIYYIEIALKPSSATRDADVVGTVTLNKSKQADGLAPNTTAKLKDAEFDVAFNVSHKNNYLNYIDAALIDGNNSDSLKPDNAYLLKFDNDDEVDITFGVPGTENEGTYTVDISGQGKVFLYFTTDANEAIIAANPAAQLRFLNFNTPANKNQDTKFNRTGEFCYEWEDVQYVYQVITDEDGNTSLKVPAGAHYEASDEAVYFNTRALGNYVFSDVELTMGEVAGVEEIVPEEVISNPTTGGTK